MRFLHEVHDARQSQSKLGVDDILEIAALAHSFIEHPYWRRMTVMLRNTESAEVETLLDQSQTDKHAIARASVANIRKVLAMPQIDIAQGEQAVKAVEAHQARFGNEEWFGVNQRSA